MPSLLAALTVSFIIISIAAVGLAVYKLWIGDYLVTSPYKGGTLLSTWYLRGVLWFILIYGSFYAFNNQMFSLSIILVIMATELYFFVGWRNKLFGDKTKEYVREDTRVILPNQLKTNDVQISVSNKLADQFRNSLKSSK